MPVKLNSSGGGSVTLTTPSTASDFTVTVPAVTGTMSVQASTGYTTGSVLFINSSGQVAQNNSQLFWDNTNNYLGIGTASPAEKLTVAGAAIATSAASSIARDAAIIDFSSNTARFVAGRAGGSYGTWSAYVAGASGVTNRFQIDYDSTFLWFGSDGTSERARIDSSGNFFLNTTSQFGSAKQTTLSSTACLGLQCSGTSATTALVIGKNSNDATTAQVLVQFLYNGYSAGLGQINGNGGSQAAFGSYSDERLKENIVSLPTQLENICNLRPVEFDYIDGNGHQIGFIAQEMQKVYPDVVAVGNDEMLTVTGWNKTEARLVKAIQELSAKLDAAEARIAALEAK